MDKVLYTIGYGNRKPDELLKILKDAGIRTILDVRRRGSKAWRRVYWSEQPNGEYRIGNWLFTNGIKHLQPAIFGNYYDSLTEYADSLMLADKIRNIQILADDIRGVPNNYGWQPYWCLLCAETDPAKCHRSILAEKLLEMLGDGWKVVHL